jgi:hypothetical protein
MMRDESTTHEARDHFGAFSTWPGLHDDVAFVLVEV